MIGCLLNWFGQTRGPDLRGTARDGRTYRRGRAVYGELITEPGFTASTMLHIRPTYVGISVDVSQCPRHSETSCSASSPSASKLLHSLRPLVNVSSPPSASLSSAACFITALRDQLLPVPLVNVRLQNRCFTAPRLQRAGVRKTARCHCVEQLHFGSVCDRSVTRPSPPGLGSLEITTPRSVV